MSKIAYVVSFVAGGVVGAVGMRMWMNHQNTVTLKGAEKEAVLDRLKEALEAQKEELTKSDEDVIDGDCEEINNEEEHYIKLVNTYKPMETTSEIENGPYVISSMEYGDFEDYQCISLTYTADGVLIDTDFEQVEDIDETVGKDYEKHFGAYPDDPDTVYIRNDALCCDFEICKDLRTAADFSRERPHMRWRDNE